VKGATSGNVQSVREVRVDCDRDAVLVRVTPAGPACHTGARSCFFEQVAGSPAAPETVGETLARLEQVIRGRKSDAPAGSYTATLYADENLRHKKIGEEATELVMASMRGDKDSIAREAADVVYHLLVLLQSHGLGLEQVAEELRRREGVQRNPR
jgi:phosphoribosyl-ATP pyrophosphohydrolase/phosphoribosyl-AMP cyclohydrolase